MEAEVEAEAEADVFPGERGVCRLSFSSFSFFFSLDERSEERMPIALSEVEVPLQPSRPEPVVAWPRVQSLQPAGRPGGTEMVSGEIR